jgi:hypothetical protein
MAITTGVYAANPSGALGLHEGLGFEVDMRSNAYWGPLPLDAASAASQVRGIMGATRWRIRSCVPTWSWPTRR